MTSYDFQKTITRLVASFVVSLLLSCCGRCLFLRARHRCRSARPWQTQPQSLTCDIYQFATFRSCLRASMFHAGSDHDHQDTQHPQRERVTRKPISQHKTHIITADIGIEHLRAGRELIVATAATQQLDQLTPASLHLKLLVVHIEDPREVLRLRLDGVDETHGTGHPRADARRADREVV